MYSCYKERLSAFSFVQKLLSPPLSTYVEFDIILHDEIDQAFSLHFCVLYAITCGYIWIHIHTNQCTILSKVCAGSAQFNMMNIYSLHTCTQSFTHKHCSYNHLHLFLQTASMHHQCMYTARVQTLQSTLTCLRPLNCSSNFSEK